MCKHIRRIAAISFVFGLAACDMQPQEEFVVVERETVSFTSTYTGKYR